MAVVPVQSFFDVIAMAPNLVFNICTSDRGETAAHKPLSLSCSFRHPAFCVPIFCAYMARGVAKRIVFEKLFPIPKPVFIRYERASAGGRRAQSVYRLVPAFLMAGLLPPITAGAG